MNFKKLIMTAMAAVIGSYSAMADEGMWMIHAIDAALEKNMKERGLELSAGEIYNADAPGSSVADAVVSMEFGCTGSMISKDGLLITNHHCAYGDVHALSTPEHNYLEEGFWAMRAHEEVNIKDKSVYFLKRVIDVTDEVEELKKELTKLLQIPSQVRGVWSSFTIILHGMPCWGLHHATHAACWHCWSCCRLWDVCDRALCCKEHACN